MQGLNWMVGTRALERLCLMASSKMEQGCTDRRAPPPTMAGGILHRSALRAEQAQGRT